MLTFTKRRKKKKKLIPILLGIVFLFGGNLLLPEKTTDLEDQWFKNTKGAPLIIAHQGGNQERPASTNIAFEHAVALGVDILEFDVALTKDDQLITIHDLTVDRTTNGTGKVRELAYSEIKELNAAYGLENTEGKVLRGEAKNPYIAEGAYIPTLQDVFSKYPKQKMLIELKDAGEDGKKSAEVFWNLVQEYNMEEKIVVASFDRDTIRELRKISNDKIKTTASEGEMYYFYGFHKAMLPSLNNLVSFEILSLPIGYNIKGINIDLTTEALLKEVRARKMPIYYWTINSEEEMEALIDLGADGIITDRPQLLLQVLKKKGLR
ncbi:glycerophosphodiester phosphodiesterase [Alkaliphilus hydrothermalis]|uniref:Glycerophosphoryl diester phosphodiesterase n=1 Tax=Alkaliphilus hydrothermalis TaxID=1482730 RepID=A0ABS2NNF9_9FIRM|nr:glycerophosphodiester phosphodiesterase [Alkaliphilus hydrothermalis]MBM7614482.1 glycerophosphoryl diester phosphodiesterase [Alkaliphilus hydrothermalis]